MKTLALKGSPGEGGSRAKSVGNLLAKSTLPTPSYTQLHQIEIFGFFPQTIS
jgi:hypothetical protein